MNYINKNKNKNYKYDIILDEGNNNKLFHEKMYEPNVKYLEDNEKEFLENLKTLNEELTLNIEALQKSRFSKDYDNKVT